MYALIFLIPIIVCLHVLYAIVIIVPLNHSRVYMMVLHFSTSLNFVSFIKKLKGALKWYSRIQSAGILNENVTIKHAQKGLKIEA